MRKMPVVLVVACLLATVIMPASLALPPLMMDSMLASLEHNCPNTGIMLPQTFSPYESSYLLTVASWVSRVNFTPVSASPLATILVNGTAVISGHKTADFVMTDKPQAVNIVVTGPSAESRVYTVFLQRRPSEARTYSSVGYLKKMYLKSGKYYMDFDLVTATWEQASSKALGFTNESKAIYKYPVRDNAILYWGDRNYPTRSLSPGSFLAMLSLDGSEMFRVVYLEDEIVAVTPYAPD